MAVGQPTFVTDLSFQNVVDESNFIADGNYAWEWWYHFQVTNIIPVTPAMYCLSRPLGALTNMRVNARIDAYDNDGGLLKANFRF